MRFLLPTSDPYGTVHEQACGTITRVTLDYLSSQGEITVSIYRDAAALELAQSLPPAERPQPLAEMTFGFGPEAVEGPPPAPAFGDEFGEQSPAAQAFVAVWMYLLGRPELAGAEVVQ